MASKKQKVWLVEYLRCWNATEAGRRAGYKDPNNNGPRNLKIFEAEIKEAIEAKKMSADEVLIRLANMARGNIAEFAHIENSKDLNEMGDKAAIVKKFKQTVTKYDTNYELELYDAKGALELLGKHLGLFKDRVEHSGKVQTEDVSLTDEERANRILTILDRAGKRRDRQSDNGD
jgi:phage terminase small subunit